MMLALIFAARLIAADVIYHNGVIVTMDRDMRTVQAVAVENGKVVAAGSDAEILKLGASKKVDLAGRAMLPGFYATHDHFPHSGLVALYQVDLNSPPIGKMQSIDDIVEALKKKAGNTAAGEWVVGRGYDDTLVRDNRHPTRKDLDRASTTHPIWITHVSGHLGVANSKALQLAKVTRDTPQPRGGVVRMENGEPNGVFEESLGMVTKLLPATTLEQRLQAVRHADREYLSKGVTTTVIAGTQREMVITLKTALARGFLHLNVNAMLAAGNAPERFADTAGMGSANGQLRVSGVKIVHDGSIQGYTGYLGAPYHKQPEGKQDYRGYPSRERRALIEQVMRFHRGGYQIAIHGNGDAAIDDILDAYRAAQSAMPRSDARHRIEHCQMAREDQLDRMRDLGVSPSFFEAHVYYWGDRHRDLFLGPVRASQISPLASALRRGITFTLHNDTPVTPVDPMLVMWAAVNRLTRGGQVLGPQQRIAVADALKAVTIGAAWQNHEEKTKGSIEAGKWADVVIVDQNPLRVDPLRIRDVTVLETIVRGTSVYRHSAVTQ